jgi:hypothetical protein
LYVSMIMYRKDYDSVQNKRETIAPSTHPSILHLHHHCEY